MLSDKMSIPVVSSLDGLDGAASELLVRIKVSGQRWTIEAVVKKTDPIEKALDGSSSVDRL